MASSQLHEFASQQHDAPERVSATRRFGSCKGRPLHSVLRGIDDALMKRSPSLLLYSENESGIAAEKSREQKTKQPDAKKRGFSAKRRRREEIAALSPSCATEREEIMKDFQFSEEDMKELDELAKEREKLPKEVLEAQNKLLHARCNKKAAAIEARKKEADSNKKKKQKTEEREDPKKDATTAEDAARQPDAIKRGIAAKEAGQLDAKKRTNQARQPGVKTRWQGKIPAWRTDSEPPDAHERGRATEKAYDGSLPPINGLICIVRIFAVGWFPLEVSESLHKAARKLVVGGGSSTQQAVESFKQGFLRIGGKSDGPWNTNLTDALSQLCEFRRSFKNEFSPLSETETSKCMWTWARKCLLTPQQQQLPKRRQRSLFNRIVNQQAGCHHRLRAVVKMGSDGFENVYDEGVMLLRFVHYIENVEREANSYKDAGKRMHELQHVTRPSKNIYVSLGQEASGAPSCAPARRAYGSVGQEIGGASSVPPAVLPRELQQESAPPSTNWENNSKDNWEDSQKNTWRSGVYVDFSSPPPVLKSTPKWAPRPSSCSRSASVQGSSNKHNESAKWRGDDDDDDVDANTGKWATWSYGWQRSYGWR